MERQTTRLFIPAILVFIILNAIILLLRNRLEGWGFNTSVMLGGNILVFLLSLISFSMGAKGLGSKSNPVFFRMIYGSFFLKLVGLSIAAFIYIMTVKKNVNKPALFFCMGLYVVYTFIEVSALVKSGKKK